MAKLLLLLLLSLPAHAERIVFAQLYGPITYEPPVYNQLQWNYLGPARSATWKQFLFAQDNYDFKRVRFIGQWRPIGNRAGVRLMSFEPDFKNPRWIGETTDESPNPRNFFIDVTRGFQWMANEGINRGVQIEVHGTLQLYNAYLEITYW